MRPFLFLGLLVAYALFLTGCATTENTRTLPTTELGLSEREEALRGEARHWQGTPHVLGGTSRQGVDCSGLIVNIFQTLFDYQLPRTTEEQARLGHAISRRELQPGDLVFFRPTPKTRHVGIYLSGGEFVHASASSGVMVSHLEERYWRQRYWQSRRLLAPAPTPAADRDTVRAPASERSGW